MEDETENNTVTVDIDEAKSDDFSLIKSHNEKEIKRDRPHNGNGIDEIIVSQYMEDEKCVATYSKEDNSIQRWSVDAKKNGKQQRDVYFKLDKSYEIAEYIRFVLRKNILLFVYFDDKGSRKYFILAQNK
jgi:hypothetical protein